MDSLEVGQLNDSILNNLKDRSLKAIPSEVLYNVLNRGSEH